MITQALTVHMFQHYTQIVFICWFLIPQLCIIMSFYACFKGQLQNPTAGWPVVSSSSGRLSLFRTIEPGRNRLEPPGFETVPN